MLRSSRALLGPQATLAGSGKAKSVRVADATVSHQHPVVFIPIRTACVCPICATCIPTQGASNRNRPGSPQSSQGPKSKSVSPYAPIWRGFAPPSHTRPPKPPCPLVRLSVLSLDR